MARGVTPRKFSAEKISQDRIAWLRTYLGQFVVFVRPDYDDEGDHEAPTPTVQLGLTRPGGRQITYNITALTKDELDRTRQFFNMLFDMAEPLIVERDKVAQDAADQGDDSFIRIYRQVPELVVRSGALSADGQVLWQRPSDAAPRAGADDTRDGGDEGGLRGDSPRVAPAPPSIRQPEDDEPQAD